MDGESLEVVAREELACLWGDLNGARRRARNGTWSVQCDDLAERIKRLTVLVGPTPWDDIQIPLLEDGVYQRLHEELGVEAPVDMERVTAAWAAYLETNLPTA